MIGVILACVTVSLNKIVLPEAPPEVVILWEEKKKKLIEGI